MRLTKIYTKVGDKGKTLLANGQKVSKSAERIAAYGDVDELNAVIGLWRDEMKQTHADRFKDLDNRLLAVQNDLFDIGGELATPLEHLDISRQQVVQTDQISTLEYEIDTMNDSLSELENFILPGGERSISLAHLARTVCRRAERGVVRLANHEPVREEVCIYLNRLSDWFFVTSRKIAHELKVSEILWQQKK